MNSNCNKYPNSKNEIEKNKSVPVDNMLLENEIRYDIFLDKIRELKNGKVKVENVSKEEYYIDALVSFLKKDFHNA